jgi:hypothetical protein
VRGKKAALWRKGEERGQVMLLDEK